MTMGALCEAVVAEATKRNVCVYYDAADGAIVVSNNVRPSLDDVDATGSDARKWDYIDNAWHRIRKVAARARVPVENFYPEGGTLPCSRIHIPVALASEDLKRVCKNGYQNPKRPATEASDDKDEAPAKRARTSPPDEPCVQVILRSSDCAGCTGIYLCPPSVIPEPVRAKVAKGPEYHVLSLGFPDKFEKEAYDLYHGIRTANDDGDTLPDGRPNTVICKRDNKPYSVLYTIFVCDGF